MPVTPEQREQVVKDYDTMLRDELDRVMDFMAAGMGNIYGRDECADVKAHPSFYKELAERVVEFNALYPRHAVGVLARIFWQLENLPTARAEMARRNKTALSDCATVHDMMAKID